MERQRKRDRKSEREERRERQIGKYKWRETDRIGETEAEEQRE